MTERLRRSPRFLIAALAIATFGLALPFAEISYEHSLGPLDLAAAHTMSTVVVDRHGRLLRAFTTSDGRWRLPVRVRDVDPTYIKLLETYEDGRFPEHHGVDWIAVGRALAQMVTYGHVVSGASTLTMQVARLLEPRENRTLSAKLRQMVRAEQLEERFTKRQILDLYLVLAPMGGNLEGVRAASLAYFGKEPKHLTLAQAALLVALPQAPEARRPDRAPETARRARDHVLDRAVDQGVLTLAEADAAKAEPVPHGRRALPVIAPHAAEEARHATPRHAVLRLSIDQRVQLALEGLAREAAQRIGPKISLAIVVLDNATGEIRARIGAADYFSVPRAGAIDMSRALRSPGSTLKPFVYALAFENGIAHPQTMLEDRPTRFGIYAPQNFDHGFEGEVTAREALQNSLNIPALELLEQLGPARLLARLRNAGAHIEIAGDEAPGLAIGLGGLGVDLVDLAKLYCGLARGGTVPHVVERLDLPHDGDADRRIAEPVAAWYVFDILRGAPPPANALPGRIAYKTGTSYGYRDAFAVGYDRRMTVAVWVGRADNGAVPGLVGRAVAAPVLFDAFARIGGAPEPLVAPQGILVAARRGLPPPLRRLHGPLVQVRQTGGNASLKIAYPPDGAEIDLGLAESARGLRLALKAQGGAPPFTWLVDGRPIGAAVARRDTSWAPDGAGFARVSVMDSHGASASVMVRIE